MVFVLSKMLWRTNKLTHENGNLGLQSLGWTLKCLVFTIQVSRQYHSMFMTCRPHSSDWGLCKLWKKYQKLFSCMMWHWPLASDWGLCISCKKYYKIFSYMVWRWPLASNWGLCKSWKKCQKLFSSFRTWCDVGPLQAIGDNVNCGRSIKNSFSCMMWHWPLQVIGDYVYRARNIIKSFRMCDVGPLQANGDCVNCGRSTKNSFHLFVHGVMLAPYKQLGIM